MQIKILTIFLLGVRLRVQDYMEMHRYITRYNGQKGTRNTFCGWRLCITRQKETYVRYFTDREYEKAEASLSAALEVRDAMMNAMANGESFASVCERFRKAK